MEHADSIVIARPPEAVWALVGGIDGWPLWLRDVSDVHLPGGMTRGASFTYKYRGNDVEGTIAQYERGRLVGISQQQPGYDFWESIRLDPDGQHTRVVFTIGFSPRRWWLRVVAIFIRPFRRWVLGSSIRRELAVLKKAVETPS